MSPLELSSNIVIATSILLAARNSVHTWWTGIIGCALFAILFWRHQLYAEVVLQGFFIATSGYGWWHWLHGKGGSELPVQRASRMLLAGLGASAVLVAAGYGFLLQRFTDAYAPFADATVLMFSVLAQLLLMKRRLETWAFWLVVNTIAVPLFATRGLHLTAGLYAAYWFNAWYGAWRWRRELEGA